MTDTDRYILAVDQGTSGTKSILFNQKGEAVARGTEALKTYYSEGGGVEQNPKEIYANVLASVQKCLTDFQQKGGRLEAIETCGISNQRETFILWDQQGEPLYNAIVWQCKRSVGICNRLISNGLQDTIQSKTGLIIDPYFSGTKLIWLYENQPEVQVAIQRGEAYFGTVDTWLLHQLTQGQSYYTDHTNASRTLFFNLSTLEWDQELLEEFRLENLRLPEVKASSSYFGKTNFGGLLSQPIAITALIGDSHAAAFGEGCFEPGLAKATMGTGSSILMNIGKEPKHSRKGMMTTLCWSTEDRTEYALEGVIVTCGATIEWLKNQLGMLEDSRQTEAMARSVADNNGVYLVPAFSGLGAPHWDMNRKASISGLTFDCNKNHLVRAALESIPYQIKDVILAMEEDTGIALKELMVDGGLTSNQFVLQFLANLLDKPVASLTFPEVSALGAAYLAGLKAGIFQDIEELKLLHTSKSIIKPDAGSAQVHRDYAGWQRAIGTPVQELITQ